MSTPKTMYRLSRSFATAVTDVAVDASKTNDQPTASKQRYFFYNQKFNKDPLKNKLKNMQRKIRRNIYSATTPEKFEKILTNPEYDNYLRNEASDSASSKS